MILIVLDVLSHSSGISYVPITKEDEIHNVQLVVDHLGDKVLHCDLSHIDGRAVVEGDRVAMQYLLEILLGVMDYIMGGIDSEGSATDFEGLPGERVVSLKF